MNSVKERPILFNGPMVRAILEGRKTQARRVVKPQPAPNEPNDGGTSWHFDHEVQRWRPFGTVGHLSLKHKMGLRCPYGEPGDRLWVRETFAAFTEAPYEYPDECDEIEGPLREWSESWGRPQFVYRADQKNYPDRWRPSIHMPRWASRITLEVTGVRVERLQDISEDDAEAEGVTPDYRGHEVYGTAVDVFSNLWESINGPGSWLENPWVWVVEFQRTENE